MSGNKRRRAETQVINFRMPNGLVEDIEKIVDNRMYKSRSDFIISAVRHYIEYMSFDEILNKDRAETMKRMYMRGQIRPNDSTTKDDSKRE